MARNQRNFQDHNLLDLPGDMTVYGLASLDDLMIVDASDCPETGIDRAMSLANAPVAGGPVGWQVPGIIGTTDMLALVKLGAQGVVGGGRIIDKDNEAFCTLRTFGGDWFISITYKTKDFGDSVQTGEVNIGALPEWCWARTQIEGTTFRAKVWGHGANEPGAWQKTLALHSSLAQGQAGFGRHAGDAGGALAFISVSDDLDDPARVVAPLSHRTLTTVELVTDL